MATVRVLWAVDPSTGTPRLLGVFAAENGARIAAEKHHRQTAGRERAPRLVWRSMVPTGALSAVVPGVKNRPAAMGRVATADVVRYRITTEEIR